MKRIEGGEGGDGGREGKEGGEGGDGGREGKEGGEGERGGIKFQKLVSQERRGNSTCLDPLSDTLYGMLLFCRPEKLEYKEILTLSWREVGVMNGSEEDATDSHIKEEEEVG